MSYIQNFFTSRDNNANGNSYIGQQDRLWYNPDTNSIRISDGVTPGGKTIDLDLGANATFDIATACTVITGTLYAESATVYGELRVDGNISPAANGKIGGITPGPGVNVSNAGVLTIDNANLPISFGNFYANNNVLSIVNLDEDMILQTNGGAEIQLVGNIGFYIPDGLPPNIANRYFYATSDGSVHSKYLDIQSFGDTGIAAPFNVTIDTTGNYRPPAVLSGTIAQFTGNGNVRSYVVQDNYGVDPTFGTGGQYVFRTARGNVDAPATVQTNDRIGEITAAGWASNGYGGQGSGFYRIVANENFTPTARGGRLEMWVVPNGTTTETKIATVDSNGLSVTGTASISGNVNAGNLVLTTGNIIYTPRHGSFYSNVDQTNPIANTAMAMTFNNTVTANGVSIVSNSQLTIAKPGVYNIQFSAQVAKTGGGTGVVDIWLNQNGAPVAWTNTSIPVTSGTPAVAAWNFVENVTVANTYYQLMWSSPDTGVLLDSAAANTNPTRPGIPSVIVTVTPVGA